MRSLIIASLALAFASGAVAGGWPREKGTVFLSTTVELEFGDNGQQSATPMIFAEYGLPRRLTIGVDAYYNSRWDRGQALVFLRMPLSPEDRPHKFATSFGIGYRQGDFPEPVLRTSLNWGYGLHDGWLSADLHATYLAYSGETEFKLEALWGQRYGQWSAMAGLVAEQSADGQTQVDLSPALAWKLNDRISLFLAADIALTDDSAHALRLGTWFSF